MLATIKHNGESFKIDLSKPIDISIPLEATKDNPIAWYQSQPIIEPVKGDGFIGSVAEGFSVNFNNIHFNPHAHGTHTECLGHITKEFYSINTLLKEFFFKAQLITVEPELLSNGDMILQKSQFQSLLNDAPEALVVRTMPNSNSKKSKNYSHTNPPYLSEEAAVYLREIGIKHLLIDLPSVDKEKDGGALKAHKAFWNVASSLRLDATITEFIFVDSSVPDGNYVLNLQIAPFENDASPSKPVLFKVLK